MEGFFDIFEMGTVFGKKDFGGRIEWVVYGGVGFFWVIFGPIGNVFVDTGFKGSCGLIRVMVSAVPR